MDTKADFARAFDLEQAQEHTVFDETGVVCFERCLALALCSDFIAQAR